MDMSVEQQQLCNQASSYTGWTASAAIELAWRFRQSSLVYTWQMLPGLQAV